MILVCGECLVDLAPVSGSPGLWRAYPGGSPANTAVALARLDVPASFAGRLSRDNFGTQLRGHLSANHVDLSHSVDADEPTTLAVVSVDAGGHAAYTFHLTGTADWGWRPGELPNAVPAGVSAVHAGSMALMMEPGCHDVEAFLRRVAGQCVVSIDPNVRPVTCDDPTRYAVAVERWLSFADVVKVSSDDVAWLYPGRDGAEVARGWAAAGPALVVLTSGAAGALAVFDGGSQCVDVPAVPVEVVDTVGAGDAFSAGLLCALEKSGHFTPSRLRTLTHERVHEAVSFAARVAALACTRPGAVPPYSADLAAGS